mgnify:FL=1|jgi:hypothetical protein
MAFNGKKYAAALKIQTAVDVPATVTAASDALILYDLRPSTETYTLANPEATGTVDRPGDTMTGRSRSVSFNVIIRGPGGATPPAVDTFVLGRLLRLARFAETSQTTAALASGAVSAGTTTSAVLPAPAVATDDAYNGLCAILSSQSGSGLKQVSMIRDYVGSTKTATFMETFGTSLTGNITIPPYLGYLYSDTAPDLFASFDYWLDKKRYKMVNAIVSSLQLNFQVSNNSDTAFTYLSVTLTGDVHPSTPEVDEASPTIAQGGAMPIFNDADFWLGGKSFCGSGATVDFQMQTARAPCPGSASGGEAPVVTEVRRSATMNINEVLLATADLNQLAAAQGYHGMWLQYGQGGAGKCVSFGIPDARLGFSDAEIGGDFVTRSVNLMIDGINKSMSIQFPYGF